MTYERKPIAIEGWEMYECDTNGVIYGKSGKPLKCSTNPKGYCVVNLYNNNIRKGFSVHTIIATTFLERSEEKNQVNHKNGNKTDNSVENLEWVTAKENIRHSVDVLGNYIEGNNHNARDIYGIDLKTHKVKYKFTSLIGAARFLSTPDKNSRHIQTIIWKVINHIDNHKSYCGCLWFYENDCPYPIDETIDIAV